MGATVDSTCDRVCGDCGWDCAHADRVGATVPGWECETDRTAVGGDAQYHDAKRFSGDVFGECSPDEHLDSERAELFTGWFCGWMSPRGGGTRPHGLGTSDGQVALHAKPVPGAGHYIGRADANNLWGVAPVEFVWGGRRCARMAPGLGCSGIPSGGRGCARLYLCILGRDSTPGEPNQRNGHS